MKTKAKEKVTKKPCHHCGSLTSFVEIVEGMYQCPDCHKPVRFIGQEVKK